MVRKKLVVITFIFISAVAVFAQAEPVNLQCFRSSDQVVEATQCELKPGSLIIHRGDCLTVKLYTQSPYTHVAIVMPDESQGWVVYDSANGHGVRKSKLNDYLKEPGSGTIELYHLSMDLSQSQCDHLSQALSEELGRPYAVKHYVTGKKARGVHCSEYVTDALISIDLLRAKRPVRVTPASLLQGILEAEIYQAGAAMKVTKQSEVAKKGDGWCHQLWIDTKVCTKSCYKKMGKLFLCQE